MSPETPVRVPRLLSCAVKGPLGCLAFLVGAVVVAIVLLPFAVGRLVDRGIEQWFSRRFEGSLEVGDVWFGSLYDQQRVERLILRDPGGDEVLRAEARAPELTGLLDGAPHVWGPVSIRIEVLRLVEDEHGVTNLERALKLRPEVGQLADLRVDSRFQIALELVVERLRYAAGDGSEDVLEGLGFDGSLDWGPEETSLVLEGGSAEGVEAPLHAHAEIRRPEFGPRRTWSVSLELENAPTALVRGLCGPARPLAPFVGTRIDHLSWAQAGRVLRMACEDEGAHLELEGEERDGTASAPPEGSVSLTLPCGSPAEARLFAELLPALVRPACDEAAGESTLRMEEFRWPLDGDPRGLAGVVTPALVPLRGRPVPALAGWGGMDQDLSGLGLAPSARLELGAGQVRYRDWLLVSGALQIRMEGFRELGGEAFELELTGARGEEALEPVHLHGPPAAERPTPPELPALEGLPVPPPRR